tara:strand:- start:29074 stop:29724 length:651 start_codon:yes stop_codon:yes gene_type:complete
MNDINQFLNWYLGERTRMKRGLFNVVFFVAFIPVLFVKMNSGMAGMMEEAQQYAPLISAAEEMMDGGEVDTYNIEETLNHSKQTRDITRQLMRDLGMNAPTAQSQNLEKKHGIKWGALLNILVFIALIPIIQMRLRDLNKWGQTNLVYVGLVYTGIANDALKDLFAIELPTFISASLGILTFVLVSWLCMSNSKKAHISGSAQDNLMPGDKHDDPY